MLQRKPEVNFRNFEQLVKLLDNSTMMMTISKNYIGTDHHLIFDGQSFRWSTEVNGILWDKNSPFSQLADIFSLSHPELVPEKYKKMAQYLNCSGDPKYFRLIGPEFAKSVKSGVEILGSHLGKLESKKYFQTFMKTQEFLDMLSPAKINVKEYENLKSSNGLPSGFENDHGYISKPIYSRSNSKTGRLTVAAGPGVLTLKKDRRKIISGCRQIDYSSMEPRLLLAFSGKTIDGDLYDWLKEKIGKGMTRSRAKIAILTSLYGNNTHREIEKIFEVRSWVSKLTSQVNNSVLENYFGRPINVEGVSGNKLLALWLQSSAVDAALMGFLNFFQDNTRFIPHWVIHDACIFSGKGEVPRELKITEDIYLPIACTGVSNETD